MREFFALAVLTACTPRADYATGPARTVEYVVAIDTAWTLDEAEQIIAAAADWTDATEGLKVRAFVAHCTHSEIDNEVCITRGTGEDMHDVEYRCPATSVGCWVAHQKRIIIDNKVPEHLRSIAGHEIGHAMGLQHDKAGTVMASRDDWQTRPTCRDVRAFWKTQQSAPGRCLVESAQ